MNAPVLRRSPVALATSALVALALLASCGKDSAGPDDGDGSTVLLGMDAADWTLELRVDSLRAPWCLGGPRLSTAVGEVLQGGAFRIHSRSNPCEEGYGCAWDHRRAILRSAERIDFRPYQAARLRLHVERFYQSPGWYEDYATLKVEVRIRSNVAGTGDLGVYAHEFSFEGRVSEAETGTSFVDSVDVSIETALAFGEATVELVLAAKADCAAGGDPFYPLTSSQCAITVRGFEVLAEP